MQERRKTARRRTFLAGRVEIEKLNGWAVDCVVRNVSAVGARLTIPGRVVVPQTFQMRISGAAAAPARLVWYKDGQAGVAMGAAVQSEDKAGLADNETPLRSAADETALQARIRAIAMRSECRGAGRVIAFPRA